MQPGELLVSRLSDQLSRPATATRDALQSFDFFTFFTFFTFKSV